MIFHITQRSLMRTIFLALVILCTSTKNMHATSELDFDDMYQQAEQCGVTNIKTESHPVMNTAIKYLKIIFVPIMMVGLKAKKHISDLFSWTKQRVVILYARAQIMKNYIMRRIALDSNKRRT